MWSSSGSVTRSPPMPVFDVNELECHKAVLTGESMPEATAAEPTLVHEAETDAEQDDGGR